jgi:hypothetical protein
MSRGKSYSARIWLITRMALKLSSGDDRRAIRIGALLVRLPHEELLRAAWKLTPLSKCGVCL